jgi:hypothetical protein
MVTEIRGDFESFVREALSDVRDNSASTATAILKLIPRVETVEGKIDTLTEEVRDHRGALKLLTIFADEKSKAPRTSSIPPPAIPPKVVDLGTQSPSGTWTWNAEAMSKVIVDMRNEVEVLGSHVEALTNDRDMEAQKAKWAEEQRQKAEMAKIVAERESARTLKTRAAWMGMAATASGILATVAEHFHLFH